MKKFSIVLFQLGILFVALCILLLAFFWLPQTAEAFAIDAPEYAYLQYPLLFGIWITLMPFILAIVEALRISRKVALDQVFTGASADHLKRIKLCAYGIMTLYVVGFVILLQLVEMNPGIALLGILISLTSMMIGLITGILEALLRKALVIKEENDLTV